MFYTSGTNGRPKGVRRQPMLPEQMVAAERVSAITYGVKPNENQIVLMNGPMYHSAPNSYGMLAFRHGCTIVLEPRFDPEDLLADRTAQGHARAYGADHVRASAAAAGRREITLRSFVAALCGSRRRAMSGTGEAGDDRLVGAGGS
jgi:acyl-CoA synthetase (AMP-forming)/AMP-acid ligase II